ncbi:hypothetical protein GJAV_G00206510 [Gymnothorax javanicus]|nr:hypothetical protein GJAV_G00206510 [Gymnothorax javanicus]
MMSYMWIFLLASLAFGANAQDDLDPGAAADPVATTSAPEAVPTEAKPAPEDAGDSNLAEAANPASETTAKPEKPTEAPKNPDGGGPDSFDLGDALGPDPDPADNKPKDGTGDFGDSDLADLGNKDNEYKPDGGKGRAIDPPPGSNEGGADQPQEAGAGQIAGIISGIGAAIIGAVTSYIAYQKKKLCFKIRGGEDPESGNKSDPQVMSSLVQSS